MRTVTPRRNLIRAAGAALIATAFASSSFAQQAGPIKIGLLVPLTGPLATSDDIGDLVDRQTDLLGHRGRLPVEVAGRRRRIRRGLAGLGGGDQGIALARDQAGIDIARGKALEFLVSHAEVVDESGEPIDLTLPDLPNETATADPSETPPASGSDASTDSQERPEA